MAEVEGDSDELQVPLHFLDRDDQWETMKPYNLQYYPREDIPRHNLRHTPHTVHVKDMRLCMPLPSIEVEGFGVYRLRSVMECADFMDDAKVQDIYCRELEKYFLEAFGAKHVRALDYQVRRKSPGFPYFGGRLPTRPQPSLMTHVDVTPDAVKSIVRDLFEESAEQILQSRYQVITVWKPCRVPVRDWPLAICDATTVIQADLVPCDIIYPTFVTENCMVHFNSKQKWYWLPDHEADEILAFKAFDSHHPSSWPCPHGAFPIPKQDESAQMRESIDVRLLILYADMVYPRTALAQQDANLSTAREQMQE